MNKMWSWISLTLFIVPLFITACAEQTTSVVEVPTRVVLNTPTPTLTSTASPTPLPITPTMTIRPTDTNRPSVTPTASRTSTATITATATPTRVIATATNTLTPSPTVTATPTATATPVVTATPDVAQIISFGANPTAGAAGSVVTLSWETRNVDSVRIDQLNAQGAVTQTFSVAFNGSLPVTLPNQPGQILYRLVALRLGAQVTRDVAVTVQVVCSTSWFFGNNLAPADAGCPDGPAISATGAVQPFERGLMLYINAAGLNKLYGLVYSTGSTTNGTYMVYDNGWDGVTIYPGGACPNPSGCTPPAGLLEPQGGFSWLYYNTNGPTGPWWGATGIGWGTGGADPNSAQTYQEQLTVTQGGQQITPFFILVPGYGVLRFSGTPITGTWQRVPGT